VIYSLCDACDRYSRRHDATWSQGMLTLRPLSPPAAGASHSIVVRARRAPTAKDMARIETMFEVMDTLMEDVVRVQNKT
jgi:hypothetical protein